MLYIRQVVQSEAKMLASIIRESDLTLQCGWKKLSPPCNVRSVRSQQHHAIGAWNTRSQVK